MELSKKEVNLWSLSDLGLIILCNSGVVYSNQVGGVSCMQFSEEGILTIIEDDIEYVRNGLFEITKDYPTYLTLDHADKIDLLFSQHSCASYIKVDRSRISESMEAWIYVDVEECMFPINGFGKSKGVLTWSNSD